MHLVADRGDGLEELFRVLDRHVEHVGDRVALELHLERLAVVAFAVAFLTRHVNVGEEVHLDLDQPVALARLAPAALDVEREPPGLVPARGAFGQTCEPVPDLGEGAGVGGGVGARGAADRALVDLDHLVAHFEAGNLVMRACDHPRAVEHARGPGVERVEREAALAAARQAGHASESAERDADRHVLQVVGPRTVDGDRVAVALAALFRHLDLAHAGEVLAGQAELAREDVCEAALRDDLSPMHPRAGTEIDDVVGMADRVLVVLDHDHGVAEIAQPLERFEQPVVVTLVQTDARFVEHVEHAREARADLAGEADALAFAAGQRT